MVQVRSGSVDAKVVRVLLNRYPIEMKEVIEETYWIYRYDVT